MVTAKIDIDDDSPYNLARQLFTLGDNECSIRLSSNKGTHLKIYGLSESQAFSIKTRLDDEYRVMLDESRQRKGVACTNVLWDKKNNLYASVWIHSTVRRLAFFLLRSTSRSLRYAIQELFNYVLNSEFTVLGVMQ